MKSQSERCKGWLCVTCGEPVILECDKSICAGAKFARLTRLEAVAKSARILREHIRAEWPAPVDAEYVDDLGNKLAALEEAP